MKQLYGKLWVKCTAIALLVVFAVLFAAAALGSALIDLYGFAIYAPFTLVIKGAMGFFAGKFLKSGLSVKNIAIVIAISAFMVLAYFLTDMVLYGWAAALGSALGNVTQALASIALGCVVLALPVERIRG